MTKVPMTAVSLKSLRGFVFDILRAMGVPEEEAEIFGSALIFSELRFHPGHGQGVKKLRRYQSRFAEGGIDPAAPWEILKESPALALVSANNGIGTVAATRAMRLAIEKSKVCGIGQVIVRDSTHFGSSAVHACLGPNAKAATRRHYIFASLTVVGSVAKFMFEHCCNFAAHQPIYVELEMGSLVVQRG